jgi:hypothetical protein
LLAKPGLAPKAGRQAGRQRVGLGQAQCIPNIGD